MSAPTPSRTVAVVGAGISGAACAVALRAGGARVRLFDRGRVAGGRLASRRIEGRYVDLGASYLTATDARFQQVVDDWVARGLARPWTNAFHVATPAGLGGLKPGPLRYGAAGGLRSLIEDLLEGFEVAHHSEVSQVGPGARIDGRQYAAVVLAMPDPQALRLLCAELTAERAAVADRAWEPVLTLAAGWPERCWGPEFDGCFVNDSPVLGWIGDDGRRRGDGAPVLVAHSTSLFAAPRLEEPQDADTALLAELRKVLAIDIEPTWTQVQRWSLARPTGPREELFHLGAAGVSLCGDGWGSPRVETAWLSGTLLGQELARQLSLPAELGRR